ncbi:MAG: calcium-binding protein [Planctomycetota bacterium]
MRSSHWIGAMLTLSTLAAVAGAHVIERVSVTWDGQQARGDSMNAAISGDGRFVAFDTWANLVPEDTFWPDVYLRDRHLSTTIRVSVSFTGEEVNGSSSEPAISADGRFVSFASNASNLVANDSNGRPDVFLRDMLSGTTWVVSVSSSGEQGNGISSGASVSAGGRFIAFESKATNLVPGDGNGLDDVFVHDMQTGETTRVSIDSYGNEGNGRSTCPSISADGRFVAFESGASNLVPGDTNAMSDVFVHDRQTGTTTRVSVASGGAEAHGASAHPSISIDGRWVAFHSEASDLVDGDTNECSDIFLSDSLEGATIRVSVDSQGREANGWCDQPALSGSGRFIVFESMAMNLVPDQSQYGNNIFLHDASTRTTIRLSNDLWGDAVDECRFPCISADGRFAAFDSTYDDLVPGDTNRCSDVFACDTCPPSSWQNHGQGWPGTNGIPALVLGSAPDPCAFTTLVVENSRRAETLAVLFTGVFSAEQDTAWGGTLLVLPERTLSFILPEPGVVWPVFIPCDAGLCHTRLHLQALELDPGASRGVSFSRGLELRIGH